MPRRQRRPLLGDLPPPFHSSDRSVAASHHAGADPMLAPVFRGDDGHSQPGGPHQDLGGGPAGAGGEGNAVLYGIGAPVARTTVTAHRGCGRRICAGPPRGDARFQTMREFAAAIAEGDGGDVAAAMAAHNPSPRYLERSQPLSSPSLSPSSRRSAPTCCAGAVSATWFLNPPHAPCCGSRFTDSLHLWTIGPSGTQPAGLVVERPDSIEFSHFLW